jgi:DUF4097 and DUF4098 domain-containing protein YvlB
MSIRRLLVAVMVTGVWLIGSAAFAQQSDTDWLAQCRDHDGDQYRHCEVRPVKLAATASLNVDAGPNGGVKVTGSDRATVEGSARVQVQADSEAEARQIAGEIVIDATGSTIHTNGPSSGHGRSWSVSFVLSTPRRIDLELETVNGPIGVTDIKGRVVAETVNGPVFLTELAGDVRARTTNGPMKVVLAGTTWDGVGLDAETQNGPASVAVPDGYSAQLEVGTVNGPLRLGFPITMTIQGDLPSWRSRSIDTSIGSGGAPIRVRTTNGPVTVERR